jgi:hypothetical protein
LYDTPFLQTQNNDMTNTEILHLRTQLGDIYKDYRNICLNKKYYAYRLRQTQKLNFWYEIILAIGTSGTVAGWAIWQQPNWQPVWIAIGAVVAICSVIKPIINFSADIERFTTLETKFNALQIDFETLCFDIKRKKNLDESLIKLYKEIREKLKDFGVKEDSAPPIKLLRRLQKEVNQEIPASSLWSPK